MANETQPTKHMACGDIVPGCPFTASAPTEAELMQKVAVHAAESHGITQITPDLVAKLKSVIKTS
jgi:predicted small metal-binding protein